MNETSLGVKAASTASAASVKLDLPLWQTGGVTTVAGIVADAAPALKPNVPPVSQAINW